MFPFFLMPIFASAAQAQATATPPVIVKAYRWAPFVSPMGEPFRSRSPEDDPFARWFHQADRNRDGLLAVDEMRADAERFFALLDGNEDGRIDSEERMTYEAEITPEVQVNSRWMRTRQEIAAEVRSDQSPRRDPRQWDRDIDGYQIDGLQGAARYGLLNLPEPVAGADANLDRYVSLDEFRRAAEYRFELLDGDHAGRLTLKGLEVLLPSRPTQGRRGKRPKNAVDTRIAVPVPMDD